MNKREKMQSLLAGEKQEESLQWLMSLTSMENAKRLIPEALLYEGYSLYPQSGSYSFAPMGEALLEKQAEFNEYIDRCAFPVGWGANAAFGHSGPGEFQAAVTERTEEYFLAEYETGVKWNFFTCTLFYQRIPGILDGSGHGGGVHCSNGEKSCRAEMPIIKLVIMQ